MTRNLINKIESEMEKTRNSVSRRKFLKLSGLFLSGYLLSNCKSPSSPEIPDPNGPVDPEEEIYLSGTLNDRGILRVYDSNKNLLEINGSDGEGFIRTDSSGKFNFQINGTGLGLEEIIIRAAHGTPENLQSWVRTINIPAASQSGISIVAVPYGEFKANPNEFRDFMYEVTHANMGETPRMFDYENFNRGIIIMKENPKGEGKFTNEQVQYIRNLVTPGVADVEKILNTSNYSVKIRATPENYMPGAGVIHIIPSTTIAGGECDFTANIENLIQGADVYLNPILNPVDWGLKGVVLHEIGHILYGDITNPNSIMGKGGITSYTSLDLKGARIIYRYQQPDYGHPVEPLKNILGENFEEWDF